MKILLITLVVILGIGCDRNRKIILWDYENKKELKTYSIIDSDGNVQSENLIKKRNLEQIEKYKYFVIKSDGYFSEDLNMRRYRKSKDTIYFSTRIESKNKPPKYESSLKDMKFEERSNKSLINRQNKIIELKDCLRPIKEKYNLKNLSVSFTIHENGDVLEYEFHKFLQNEITIEENDRKDCFGNLGELIFSRNARLIHGTRKMSMVIN